MATRHHAVEDGVRPVTIGRRLRSINGALASGDAKPALEVLGFVTVSERDDLLEVFAPGWEESAWHGVLGFTGHTVEILIDEDGLISIKNAPEKVIFAGHSSLRHFVAIETARADETLATWLPRLVNGDWVSTETIELFERVTDLAHEHELDLNIRCLQRSP